MLSIDTGLQVGREVADDMVAPDADVKHPAIKIKYERNASCCCCNYCMGKYMESAGFAPT
jgi:hypothetical protein